MKVHRSIKRTRNEHAGRADLVSKLLLYRSKRSEPYQEVYEKKKQQQESEQMSNHIRKCGFDGLHDSHRIECMRRESMKCHCPEVGEGNEQRILASQYKDVDRFAAV